MINERTIKECRLEKEYAQVIELFNNNLGDIEIYISTDKMVNSIVPIHQGGTTFNIKSNDLLEIEAKEKGLDVMVFDENIENAFNLIVLAKPSDLYDFNENEMGNISNSNYDNIIIDFDEKLKEI